MNLKHDKDLETAGSCLQGYFRATYKELYDFFGEPCEGDGYKVSSQWKVSRRGNNFTIYDWKATNLYSEELPHVEAFREDSSPKFWHVGGICDPNYFLYDLHYAMEIVKEEAMR